MISCSACYHMVVWHNVDGCHYCDCQLTHQPKEKHMIVCIECKHGNTEHTTEGGCNEQGCSCNRYSVPEPELCGAVHPLNDLRCNRDIHEGNAHARYSDGWLDAWVGEHGELLDNEDRCNSPHPDSPVGRGEPTEGMNGYPLEHDSNAARNGNLSEVIDNRTSVYGEVVPAFTRQAQAISAVLNHEVQPWEVPLIMVAVKLIRTTEAPDYSDNSDDIEGYLDIFRTLIGDDMVHARSVKEYVAQKWGE